MSHISTVDLRVEDLDALARGGQVCGFELVRAERMNWYGEFAGDTQASRDLIAAGVNPREYEKCDYVLQRIGAAPTSYNIGVVKQTDGSYKLQFDSWGNGQHLVDMAGGLELDKLKNEYAYAVAETYLLSEGYETHRELQADGSVVCVGVN